MLAVLVLGGIFTFFACAGLGANDAANSWASSFGSKTLLMKQVIFSAVVCECAGAFFLSNRQTDTLFKSIVKTDCFTGDPDSLMIALVCALAATAFWNCLSCRWALPISTTHSLIGAMIGIGMAHGGMECVNWSTTSAIFPYVGGVKSYAISWLYSPVLAAIASSIFITIFRHAIFYRKNVSLAFTLLYPVIVYLSVCISLLYILLKLATRLVLTNAYIYTAATWSAGAVSACSIVLLLTFTLADSSDLYWKFVDPQTYWRAVGFLGKHIRHACNLAANRKIFIEPDRLDEDAAFAKSSTDGRASGILLTPLSTPINDSRKSVDGKKELNGTSPGFGSTTAPLLASPATSKFSVAVSKPIKQRAFLSRYFYTNLNKTPEDIINSSSYVRACHDQAEDFDPKICLRFRHLTLIVAVANSITHGAKDIENGIGPYLSMIYIHLTGKIGSKTHLEISDSLWIAALGTLGLCLGIIIYSYRVTSAMGVEIGKLTPGRALCVQLSSTFVLVMGIHYKLTLSSTHCAFGALVGIASCDGMGAMNWLVVSKTVMAWMLTLCISAVVSGCLFALIQHIRAQ